MPILRPCNRPGCPELVKSGFCEEHAKEARKRRRRRKTGPRFYDKRRWRGSENKAGIRDVKLARDPLCELNIKCRDPEPATEVHHRDGNPENNEPRNLVSTCKPCHSHETAKELGWSRE